MFCLYVKLLGWGQEKLILACIFVTVLRRVYSIQFEWTVEHVEGPINQDADPDWFRGPPKDVKGR